ncbi:TetR family transcriptional regulator [Deinococcus aetherius]|uniref:TetR family transcriptional regulator n=1 Tax=Deinococcus aetherius TaxID=200252 RepID=A0ABN6RCP3_9DEIO|nr:TetR/AcrR family transcriptional regulator [Deinococcus aetherius]BDP41112.1 TetR family transcriptional regulator [Deinococcus aetherius]
MNRPRNPELTRSALLEAAGRVLQTQGAALSLDAVARAAGVSKGGLLHHYPSREALLSALALELIERFRACVEAARAREVAAHGEGPGAWLRAYIEVSFTPAAGEDALIAALAPLAGHPELIARLREAQAFVLTEAEADGLPPARAHAVRLACDALSLGPLTGLPDLDPGRRTALKEELLAWTRV